jgi:hypothetical protein
MGFGLVIRFIVLLNSTLQLTVTQRLVFGATVMLGNIYQQWTFLCSQTHVLTDWQPSNTNLILFQMKTLQTAPCYTASARTAQKTLLPTTLILLCERLLRQSLDGYQAIAQQWACLLSCSWAMMVSADFEQTCHNMHIILTEVMEISRTPVFNYQTW